MNTCTGLVVVLLTAVAGSLCCPDTVVPAVNKGYGVRNPHIIQLADGRGPN